MNTKIQWTEEKEIEIDGKTVAVQISHYFPSEPSITDLLADAYRKGVNDV